VIFTRAAREPDPNKGFGPLPIKVERTLSTCQFRQNIIVIKCGVIMFLFNIISGDRRTQHSRTLFSV